MSHIASDNKTNPSVTTTGPERDSKPSVVASKKSMANPSIADPEVISPSVMTTLTESGKPSIQILKETRELADITQNNDLTPASNDTTHSPSNLQQNSDNIIETVFKKASIGQGPPAPDPPAELSYGMRNKLRDQSSNIFPVGIMGCKEDPLPVITSPRRLLDPLEASMDNIGHIDNTPRKMHSTSRADVNRNPLTGKGMDASDDIKQGQSKKRVESTNSVDGQTKKSASNSSTHIPPGGYSHGLW